MSQIRRGGSTRFVILLILFILSNISAPTNQLGHFCGLFLFKFLGSWKQNVVFFMDVQVQVLFQIRQ